MSQKHIWGVAICCRGEIITAPKDFNQLAIYNTRDDAKAAYEGAEFSFDEGYYLTDVEVVF